MLPSSRSTVVPLLCAAIALGPLAAPALSSDAETPRFAGLPVIRPAAAGFAPERLARLDDVFQGYVDRGEVAGVVAVVARKGQVVYAEAFGDRWAEEKEPMTTDTIFRIASMTKPIASVALMMLWEEGRFQLRDPVAEHLPELAEMQVAVLPGPGEYFGEAYRRVAAERPITFQQLLTHTAGFPNSYRGVTQPLYRGLREDAPADFTVGDMIERLAELPLNFQPGERWEYGPATDVVGHLVEVMSGQTLKDFLEERIFEPLGMEDTHFFLPPEKLDRFAALYRPQEDGTIALAEAPTRESRYLRQPQVYFSGSGGLVSTAADYLRFHQMMLQGGELDGVRLLGPKTVELMTSNHIGDLLTWLRGPGYGFGLGYSVKTDLGLSASPSSVGSYGWGGAFCTSFWVDPEEEIVGILMTQIRPYTHLDIREDLESVTYQALVD